MQQCGRQSAPWIAVRSTARPPSPTPPPAAAPPPLPPPPVAAAAAAAGRASWTAPSSALRADGEASTAWHEQMLLFWIVPQRGGNATVLGAMADHHSFHTAVMIITAFFTAVDIAVGLAGPLMQGPITRCKSPVAHETGWLLFVSCFMIMFRSCLIDHVS